ncbi:response regulator [Tellurirhabdus rosea]|uniref:response regulator n=1 Tax=Tellurirhabdus rosea TaxID=2674997 RepID=UPI00225BD4B0|nr:response regulator [Tellurirhabdus rosea]
MNSPEDKETTGRRILVVDDNVDAATTLALLLRLMGNEVQACFGGREALEIGRDLRPQVIVLDIAMPNLDGYETCQLIRKQPWGADITLIALSGYGQEEDRRHSLKAGFDGHLVKPVDLEALQEMLEGARNKEVR